MRGAQSLNGAMPMAVTNKGLRDRPRRAGTTALQDSAPRKAVLAIFAQGEAAAGGPSSSSRTSR